MLILSIPLSAQDKCTISGTVVDTRGESVSYAAAVLYDDGKIFNTYRWEVHSYNKVFDLTNLSSRKSRMLWFGITYNINSFRQKKASGRLENDRSLIKLGL